MKNQNVTCRPCKEQNNWEIKQPNGQVSKTHYYSKQACVEAGRKMAEEFACELIVNDQNESSNMNKNNNNSTNENNNMNKNTTMNKTNRHNDIY